MTEWLSLGSPLQWLGLEPLKASLGWMLNVSLAWLATDTGSFLAARRKPAPEQLRMLSPPSDSSWVLKAAPREQAFPEGQEQLWGFSSGDLALDTTQYHVHCLCWSRARHSQPSTVWMSGGPVHWVPSLETTYHKNKLRMRRGRLAFIKCLLCARFSKHFTPERCACPHFKEKATEVQRDDVFSQSDKTPE